jgi:hypothetical protein
MVFLQGLPRALLRFESGGSGFYDGGRWEPKGCLEGVCHAGQLSGRQAAVQT